MWRPRKKIAPAGATELVRGYAEILLIGLDMSSPYAFLMPIMRYT